MAYILVVDGDETIRHLLYEVLTNMGHTVCEVDNGDSAVRLCQRYGFDLVILDHRIPDMDGLTIAGQFSCKSPFILHTADYENYELRSNALNAGALGVLEKISNIKAFRQEIRRFLEHLND